MTTHLSRRHVLATSALAAPALLGTRARAAGTIQMISHRYPALEYYAAKMRSAVPGTTVNTQLMPFDKALELETIAFSSKAATIDIAYANDSTFLTFAKNGWLRPLDDLWEKHKDEFKLGDFPESVLKTYRYNGHLYLMPFTLNAMLFFYRKDLFDKAHQQPPKTMLQYRDLAKSFNSPLRAGTVSCLKPVDAGLNEAHWYLNTIGDGWFDKDWHPIFNDARGVQAIELMKEITRYAQQGFTSAANDECMIAFQQDVAAMGLQWATRAKAMDDPKKSRVVGEMAFEGPPQGHARVASDGYAISAFSKQDPDTLFRIMATATSQANMRGAASLALSPRQSVMQDPVLIKQNRFYPAAQTAVATGLPLPALPEFYSVGDFITRRLLQAMTGDMTVKAALDAAAGETEKFLKGHGYYH